VQTQRTCSTFAALFAGTGAIGIAVAAVAVRPPHSAAATTSSLILFMRIPPWMRLQRATLAEGLLNELNVHSDKKTFL
jgi:hypothetical protein